MITPVMRSPLCDWEEVTIFLAECVEAEELGLNYAGLALEAALLACLAVAVAYEWRHCRVGRGEARTRRRRTLVGRRAWMGAVQAPTSRAPPRSRQPPREAPFKLQAAQARKPTCRLRLISSSGGSRLPRHSRPIPQAREVLVRTPTRPSRSPRRPRIGPCQSRIHGWHTAHLPATAKCRLSRRHRTPRDGRRDLRLRKRLTSPTTSIC